MFAPPPIQLSRDEIESRLAEQQSHSPIGEVKPVSLLRNASQSPPSPRRYFGKGEKLQVSRPLSPTSQGRFQHRDALARLQSVARADLERLYSLPPGFAEHPRQAPTPPKRPSTRPPDLHLNTSNQEATAPPHSDRAPPIPPKSLKRRSLTLDHEDAQPLPMSTHSGAISATRPHHVYWQHALVRAQTVPLASQLTSIPHYSSSDWAGFAGFGLHPGSIGSPRYPKTKTERGEDQRALEEQYSTMAVAESSAVAARHNRPYSAQELQFLAKKLPDTPDGIEVTPTELYQSLEHYQLSPTKRRGKKKKRTSPTKPPFTEGEHITSPARLSAIPEDSSIYDKTPSSSESTPTATHWHLRGGSVITVTPPELTPWLRYIFIQGPIRLQTPVSIPRNQSVASLEPFQNAIDGFQLRNHYIGRRRSDDQVWDDVCNFFDGFGFDTVSFGGDMLVSAEMMRDGAAAESVDGAENEMERFSTPPAEPGEVVREKLGGGEVAEATKRPLQAQHHSMPFHAVANPAGSFDGEDSKLHGRKDSATLTVGSPQILPLSGQ